MVSKSKIELEELEVEICEIISTRKSAKEKARLICEILTAFKGQRIIEINNIETKICALGKKSVYADDFELQKLDMEMDIILLKLLEITYEKNRFGKIANKYLKNVFTGNMF